MGGRAGVQNPLTPHKLLRLHRPIIIWIGSSPSSNRTSTTAPITRHSFPIAQARNTSVILPLAPPPPQEVAYRRAATGGVAEDGGEGPPVGHGRRGWVGVRDPKAAAASVFRARVDVGRGWALRLGWQIRLGFSNGPLQLNNYFVIILKIIITFQKKKQYSLVLYVINEYH